MKQRVERSKQMVLSQLRTSLAPFGPPPTPGSREAATPRDAAPATPDYEVILERYKFLLELGEEMPEDLVAMVTPRPLADDLSRWAAFSHRCPAVLQVKSCARKAPRVSDKLVVRPSPTPRRMPSRAFDWLSDWAC